MWDYTEEFDADRYRRADAASWWDTLRNTWRKPRHTTGPGRRRPGDRRVFFVSTALVAVVTLGVWVALSSAGPRQTPTMATPTTAPSDSALPFAQAVTSPTDTPSSDPSPSDSASDSASASAQASASGTPTASQARSASPSPRGTGSGSSLTASQVLAGIKRNMNSSKQVNSEPHINTMTRAQNVNVYQVASGVYAYTSSLAVDDDGSDPDSDPDHQGETTFQTSDGDQLGAHHVPFYVLGDDCWDRESPCPHFFYKEHGIHGRQFALMFYNGRVIGAIFGDTQTANNQTTSENDSRELGEASVKAAALLGINSSGTSGGVDNGVTVVIFSGSSWVVNGTNSTLNNNAQAMVQRALDTLGASMGL